MNRRLLGIWVGLVWGGVALALVGFTRPWAHIELRDPTHAVSRVEQTASEFGLDRLTEGLGRITATVRRGTKEVTGTLPSLGEIPRQVSGIDIPRLAHREEARLAMALVELFTPSQRGHVGTGFTGTRQELGLKSYAVYLVPGLAVLCGMLLTVAGGKRLVAWGIAAVCAAVAGAGFWKLSTVDTKTLLVAITIGHGLWLSLGAYAALALLALVRALAPK